MDRTSKLLIGIGIAGSACGDYNMILIKIPVKLRIRIVLVRLS